MIISSAKIAMLLGVISAIMCAHGADVVDFYRDEMIAAGIGKHKGPGCQQQQQQHVGRGAFMFGRDADHHHGRQDQGCEKKMTIYCPNWKTEGEQACLACVAEHMAELKPNCTKTRADKKCALGPGPGPGPGPSPPPGPMPAIPPAPPAPRKAPHPGAPQPHVVLFVVDDQGWANVGYHNPEHVITPNQDRLAADGIRLDRHYGYRWCAPSRASLMTGRLPYHVLEKTNYVTRGMTLLPTKLAQVGYSTHQVGKWHLGGTMDWMTPQGRGFNSSLGYLTGGEDHYTQFQKTGEMGCCATDLWETDAPAFGRNGTYGSYIYNAEIQRVLAAHDPDTPLFLYVALQTMHAPQEVPPHFSDLYSKQGYFVDYAIMNGMATIADEVLGNTTAALEARGMWNNTLLIHAADNGGPAGQASSGHSGNNWPLRGGPVD